MKIIQPLTVTDSTLTSSNVPETDYSEWDSGTAYSIGDNVIVTTPNVHKIYYCEVANTNNYPPDNIYVGGVAPTGFWSEVSATNRWKMFDEKVRSVTTNTDTIVVEITPGLLFNSVSLFDVDADSINITVTDPVDGIVYNHDVDMLDLTDIDYFYSWFFEPLSNINTITLTDLPAYTSATLKVTVDNTGNSAELGELVLGALKEIGTTLYGTTLGIEDYSIKEVDSSGIATIQPGVYANLVDYKVQILSNKAYSIRRTLSEYNSTPLVYIGDENVPETIVYGFFRDFNIVLENKNVSSCSIEVEELA